jgi:hypothetical protein
MRDARWLLAVFAISGCGGEVTGADEEQAPPVVGEVFGEASVNCAAPHAATGYQNGAPMSIELVTADGKPIEIKTASAYHDMQIAAARDGVTLVVVSGFRTYAEQQYLYGCYIHCSCNGCNLAARPGYSNHESGHALDLNTSNAGVYGWLERHAADYGFRRTVPSEIWHWEYWGPLRAGPCDPQASSGGGAPRQCYSHTLARDEAAGVCVQSSADGNWYKCENGGWVASHSGCTAEFAWCHSATLDKTVPPRTCVQSRSDRVWYQCGRTGWETPVANGAGPVGACSAEYAL